MSLADSLALGSPTLPACMAWNEAAWDLLHAAASQSSDEIGALLAGRFVERDRMLFVDEACLLPNVAEDPRHRFVGCPLSFTTEQARIEENGMRLLGFAHSHPTGDAQPSLRDAQDAWHDHALVLLAPFAIDRTTLRAFWRTPSGLRELCVLAPSTSSRAAR